MEKGWIGRWLDFIEMCGIGRCIDQVIIKTPNPKCRLIGVNKVYRLENGDTVNHVSPL
jgi:hypothetical protein